MKKILIISLISSSLLFAGCFNNETKTDIKNVNIKNIDSIKKSEIDSYGVDLYGIKQGITNINKIIDKGNIVIEYNKNDSLIERKVTYKYSNGQGFSKSITIDLNSKENLLSKIKETESTYVAYCKNSTEKECISIKNLINYFKSNCKTLQKNEEIALCINKANLASMSNNQFDNEIKKTPLDNYGTDLTKLKEGETTKVINDPVNKEFPDDKTITTITYIRSGDTIEQKISIKSYGSNSGEIKSSNTMSLKEFLR